ncbi:MAG: PQQ-dependent sugar dehydrogenase [Myxococcaceae bacterium]|nr:PQQ-dependent sugar dehydrogenase [Myxococcaceae bacterium]
MRHLLLVVLAVFAACASDPNRGANRLEVRTGADQTGTVARALQQPISVRLLRAEAPVAQARVTFTVAMGSGAVEQADVVTDAEGVASAGTWTLGTGAGLQSILVTADEAVPLTFSATATADVGINVAAFEGDNQEAPRATAVPIAPAKRITDTHGNPVAGLGVEWQVIEGGGSITGPTTVVTDSNGVSRVQGWVLGPSAGQNRLVARMPGLPQTTFVATATTVGMPSLTIEAGDQQSAPVTINVPVAPAVRVRDAQGQPVAGVMVTFTVASGGGTVTGSPAATDASGIARVGAWRLGSAAGAHTLTASAAGYGEVTFRASGLATGAPMLNRTVLLSGLAVPWDLTFAPDGTLVFSERGGNIRVLRPGATTSTVLHRPMDVSASGQSGMMGLALDPDFARTRHLFAYFSARVNPTTVDNRIVRFRVNEGWDGVTDRQDLLVGISWGNGGAHSGGRLRFGPDGLLYLTTGDTRSASVPQDPNALGSKVLRIRKDGTIPAGNMSAPFRAPIWAFGFRNPQGLTFRPGTGEPFLCEHGPGTDDEVTKLTAGGNGGWDPKNPANPNDGAYWGYMGTSMTDTTKFPMALRPAFRDGNSGGMSGCDFLVGAQWRDWAGAIAVASLGDRNVRVMQLSPDGLSTTGMITTLFGGMERIRAVVQGPDGALYLATDGRPGGDQIWRVTAQ